MKSKSSYHRTENTFRFKTFQERLTDINISVVRTFGKFSATPEDADTFFGEALDKWTDLNCTEHFGNFRKEISGEVQTLAQIVHHQDEVVAALIKHLQIRNSLALKPLLDLVVQLARDLQGDFYPCFPQFFNVIVSLLNIYHHETETLEQAFTCLAYLFKFLWRHMLKDMQQVYSMFCPLLGEQYREYINNFAAESFSFLLRKVKNHGDVFDFMFSSLKDSEDHVAGVGRLLFEMVRGVQQQFHSSAEQILPVLLSRLGLKKLPYDEVCEALKSMWQSMAEYTSPRHTGAIWKSLLTCIKDVHSQYQSARGKKERDKLNNHLKGLLELAHIWTSYREGLLVSSSLEDLVQVLSILLQSSKLEDDTADVLLNIVSCLLMAEKCSLKLQQRPKLISLVFESGTTRQLLMDFVHRVLDLPMFEKDLLPTLLTYCHQCMQEKDAAAKEDVLQVITEVLLHKVPLNAGTTDLPSLKPYLLDFDKASKTHKRGASFPSYCMKELKTLSGKQTDFPSNVKTLWALVFCLPHLRPIDEKECVKMLEKMVPVLVSLVAEDAERKDDLLSLLAETVNSLYLLQDDTTSFVNSVSLDLITALLSQHGDNAHTLRTADLYFTAVKDSEENAESVLTQEKVFSEVFSHLRHNLTSPYSQIRALSLHILCQFDLPMPLLPSDVELDQVGVFQICLDAETIAANVHTYRDKLVRLRRLEYGVVHNQLPVVDDIQQVPLLFLLGMLYTNFSLTWEPLIELVKSYAIGLDKEQFWQIYAASLHKAADLAEQSLFREKFDPKNKTKHLDTTTESTIPVEQSDLESLFQGYKAKVTDTSDRPDYVNFRRLLWRTMQQFPGVCEPKSRILSPLVFKFLEQEYYPEDLSAAPTQDIRKSRDDDDEDVDDTKDISQSEDSILEEAEPEGDSSTNQTAVLDKDVKDGSKKRRRAANKSLVVHLAVFAKFKSPRSLHLEPRLRDLYFQLLKHKDPGIQKVAFQCVMTYKHDYLVPYRENFDRLLDDKTFKSEIVVFSINQDMTVVKPQHRKQLLPVLMRLLYGKMQTKVGKDTSGKGHSQLRKSIILRFLAGSNPDEIHIFLDLVYEPFTHFISENTVERVTSLAEEIDLSKVIPLRKQLGALSTMDLLIKKLGILSEKYLPRLLQILTCLTGQCAHLLSQRHLLNTAAVTMLKAIRNSALTRFNQFFLTFDSYPFSAMEIDAIFKVGVWPQLERLAQEGVYSPTPLLKLFLTWTQQNRYLVLLAKVHPEKADVSPLPFVLELLHAKGAHGSVTAVIIQMVENMLVAQDEEEGGEEGEEDEEDIDAGQTVIDVHAQTDLSLGTRLLLPHVSSLLRYMNRVVEAMSSQTGRRKTIPAKELNILSRLSAYVTDPDQSRQLVSLLLPFLSRKLSRSPSVEVDILTAVGHLIKQVIEPKQFLEPIAQLFSVLSARSSRVALCSVLQAIAEKSADMSSLASLITKLNTWDPRRVEEPDYLVRLEAFQESCQLLTESKDDILMLMLVHNCVFFLATTQDMSLRDASAFCLQTLIKRLADLRSEVKLFKVVVLGALVPEVKVGLKVKVESARHEFINLLAHLVKNFPDCHSFSDLDGLRDTEDVEKDFFVNITHIQVHRRARALRRFNYYLSTHKLRMDTILSYILPMVTAFVQDETYKKQSNLLDAAVESMGAICRVMPWPRYLLLLKYYLNLLPKSLEQQRLIVRLIVAILDNFHFDLRNSHGPLSFNQKTKKDEESTKPAQKDEKAEPSSKESTENIPIDSKGDEKEPKKATQEDSEDKANDEDAVEEDVNALMEGSEEAAEMETDSSESSSDKVVCAPGLATRIHRVILSNIIHKLHQCLTRKSQSDDVHRLAQAGKYAEDEEVLRVPIALAMIKLLQGLPAGALHQHLPGILIKVCGFLKSRSKDIRNSARDTLVKVLQSLGVTYLHFILKELRSTLQRGYQLHVLAYTVWALLKNQVDRLKHGDLDSCLSTLIQVFNQELFGVVAEEKEVEGITSQVFEARSSKSFDSYGILAKFVSKDCLLRMVVPLKDVLTGTRSQKITKKVEEVLRKVCQGLLENSGLELEALLTFIYGVTIEALPMMQPASSKKKKEVVDPRLPPPSTYLLQREPPRGGHKPQAPPQTNMYVIVDFGLQLLHKLLKHSRLTASNMKHLQLMDPFVEALKNCLTSKHVKVTTSCLRCLLWVLKFPLPSLRSHIGAISNSLFILLNKYAVAGAAKGDNFELVIIGFKAMTVLVRDVDYHNISTSQLQVLLVYCEQDIHDFTRQATAFTLLKAILFRKLVVPEMEQVMHKVQQLSINADSPHVRLQCRQVVLQYLMDYPLGKKLRNHLEFFVSQLEYEYESGRESALEMMATLFSSFPQGFLVEYAGFFFVPLCSSLVNDESATCRKLAALTIKSLLNKLESSERDHLFAMCVQWLQEDKLVLRKLAALSCGLFVEVEAASFERHLASLLPIIEEQIDPDRYDDEDTSEGEEREQDHFLFSILGLLLKILRECNVLRKPKWTEQLSEIWDMVTKHLLYPHTWVRLVSAQLFGLLFGSWNPSHLVPPPGGQTKKQQREYLQQDLTGKLHSLCGAFCSQLTSPQLDNQLADQVVKNLVFLAKVLKLIPAKPPVVTESEEVRDKTPTLTWLVKRMMRLARTETAINAKVTLKRTAVFKWTAAVSLDLGEEMLPEFLPFILPPLVREYTDSSSQSDADLKSLSQEVLDLLKATAGIEVFTKQYAAAQKELKERREDRKTKRALEAVANPEIAARKKIKKQLQKKEARKRKLDDFRPARKVKKLRNTHGGKLS